MRSVRLFVPGLFGPLRDANAPGVRAPKARALETLCARAAREPFFARDADSSLLALFGVSTDAGHDTPVAAVAARADLGAADGWWLRADPVHLRADLHQLLLFDARMFALTDADAKQLVQSIAPVLEAEGAHLHVPQPGRWYLQFTDDPGIRTQALDVAAGRDIARLLPTGPNARRWHRVLTEAQMALHGAAVNARRESDGLPAVNSVWLWGGGSVPKSVTCDFDGVWCGDPFTQGLASLAGVTTHAVPESAEAMLGDAASRWNRLVVLETARRACAYQDPAEWVEAVERLEQSWIAPLLEALRAGRCDELILYGGDGWRRRVNRSLLRRFWRRPRPLVRQLAQDIDAGA